MISEFQIGVIHERATGQIMNPVNMGRAKEFIIELFNVLEVVGYIDSDGSLHAEAWSAVNPQPIYRDPSLP